MEIDVEFQDYIAFGGGDIELQEKTVTPSKETQEITASENKVLSKVTVLPIPEDYVNKNEVPKPTLNTPKIEFNANGGYMYILDGANGDFSEGYQLYLNGEENVVLNSTNIKMQDYGITETDEIGIVAKSELFNNSPMATAMWSDLELGTIGLTYSGNAWTGYGTSTEKDVYVASIVNGLVISTTGLWIMGEDNGNRVVRLPNSLKSLAFSACKNAKNLTVIFGTGIQNIASDFCRGANDSVLLDFSNVKQVPTLDSSSNTPVPSIIPDELWDEWCVTTNWVSWVPKFTKKSIWDAQHGGTV